ncbi:MAG: IS200/IS605 family element transposase accessory protein TnpB [Candidatus Heimdallarchaeota archaeon]|nr:IS200/IS605 family element transposase accessory protein TnpB [Candidatus Heimdallarchaeota archaeon]
MLSKVHRLTKKAYRTLIADLPKNELEKALKQVQQVLKPTSKKPLQLTTKVKIKPTKEQEEILWVLAENCRLVYNFALTERKAWWKKNENLPKKKRDKENKPTYNKQSAQLPHLKEAYPRYKQNYSKTLQDTLKQLEADYKSFFALRNNKDENAKPPRYKGKKYFTTMYYNQKGFSINENIVTLNHFYPTRETKKVDLTFEMQGKLTFADKKVKQVTIYQVHKTKEFYLSIIYEENTQEYYDNGIYQTIDLGVINLVAAVNSHEGKTIIIRNKRVDKYWQPKIEEVQSKRDHCKKYSNRWHWYNDKMWEMIRKQANQRKDFQHKISKKIVENTQANTIIIGDLNVKAMSKSEKKDKKNDKSRHRTMQSSGSLGRFAGFLTYKAEKVGKKVIRISERDTTKLCTYCMNKENRLLSERTIICDCGLEMDRDTSSAGTQMQRFLALLALSRKRLVVRQRLLKDFREKFFATQSCFRTVDSQTSNESSSSNRVGRTRDKVTR